MRTVNIADLKNNLSRYLNEVKQGEEVLVRDRNTPVAKIVPISAATEDEELLALAARGLISLPADEGFPKNFFTQPLAKVGDIDVVKMIREERDARY